MPINNSLKEYVWKDLRNIKQKDNSGVYDWTGTYYKINSFPSITSETLNSINVTEWPYIDDGFRAGSIEWFGFGIAIYLIKKFNYKPLMIEMGASQGLWACSWIHCLNRLNITNKIEAIGYEASPSINETIEFWSDQNFNNFKYIQNNNDLICSGDNWEFKWYNNGINYTNDKDYFPDIKCNIDNGANIDNITEIRESRNDKKILITLKSFIDVIKEYNNCTYLHLDIQGSEKKIFEDKTINEINNYNIAILQIGIHSHEIGHIVKQKMKELKYILIEEELCKMNNKYVIRDGEQLWLKTEIYNILDLNNFWSK